MNTVKSDGAEVDAEVPLSIDASGSADARQRIHQRMSALEPGLGEVGIGILLGSSALVVFYLRKVVLASAAYNGLIDTQLDLEEAAQQIATLQGIIPICAWCKAVRDDDGFWADVETYVRGRTEAEFTHSICLDCEGKYFPGAASAAQESE